MPLILSVRDLPGCRPIVALPAAAAIILGITLGKLPGNNLLWNELQNTGHTLLFGLLALLALCILRAAPASIHPRPPFDYLFAIIACLIAGIAIEFVQMLSGRGFSFTDVVRDLGGTIIALGIYAAPDPKMTSLWSNSRSRRATLFVTCCLLVASLYPLANLVYAYQIRNQAFPVIADFTARWSKPFLQLQHASLEEVDPPREWTAAAGQKSAWLTLLPARYPGVSIIEPVPDWSAYQYISLDLYSGNPEPYDLVMRVHDQLHDNSLPDRFNRRFTIHPGNNHLRVPLKTIQTAPATRDMDMAKISGIILFASDIAAPVNFHASVLRLE